jgi:porin
MSISLQYPADSGSRRGFSMALVVGSMMAMATSSPVMADDWMDRSTMTGDWEGSRSRLAAQGVKITGDYSGETVYNAHGGKQRGTRYSQNIKLGAQFDLGKLLDLESGGKIQLTINDRRGNDGSGDLVGNRLPVQENYGGLYTRLTELSYENTLFTPALNVKLGYMAMGNDLGGLSSGILCNFMNAGFCGHPLAMSGGSGWSNYPNAHLGAMAKYRFTPNFALQVAAFKVDAASNGESSRAWDMAPKDSTGNILPIEAIYNVLGDMPGEYRVGYYYDTSDASRIGTNREVAGREGSYFLMDQAIWNSSEVSGRNVHMFGQFSNASAAASPFRRWYSTGFALKKPFVSRPNDTVAIGYGRAVFNSRSREVQETAALANGQDFPDLASGEGLVEMTYGAQVAPWLTLRPSIQYIIEPGAFYGEDIDNTLIVGLQVKATL